VRFSWGYLAAAVIACALLWGLSDRWWLATAFLFGPRWLLLIPLAVLIPAAIVLRRWMLLPLLAAGAIVLLPVMGLRLGWRSWLGADDAGATLRVVTLNTGASEALGLELPFRLQAWRADIIALQECGTILRDDVRRIEGWHHHVSGQLCVISRYPIRFLGATDWRDLAGAREAGIGGSGQAAQYTIDTPGRPLRLVNLHLETAREGLQGIFDFDFQRVAENTTLRAVESRRTREWLGTADPTLIVVGDFNMPVESSIYRQYWSAFRNAFSEVGTGFGMTKDNGWIQVRIDHVLTGAGWRATSVDVGPVLGLDHRPVIVQVRPVAASKDVATPAKGLR
jgi:endonuclease/exonuclease/phosphatase (EEP) superfamily protein YafD